VVRVVEYSGVSKFESMTSCHCYMYSLTGTLNVLLKH